MSCLKENVSNQYIKFLNKSGVTVINPSEYISIYMELSSRTVLSHARKIAKAMYNAVKHEEDDSPVFYLLNLTYSKNGNNHATCLSLTRGENGKAVLEFFDPNGKLILPTKNKKGYTPDINLMNIIKEVAKLMKENHHMTTRVNQLLSDSGSLNNEGGGHCNTMTLYYVALRSQHTFKEIKDKFTITNLTQKKINQINKTISEKKMIEN